MNKPLFEFIRYLKNNLNYSDHTIDSYKRDLEKFHNFLSHEDILFDDLDLATIRNFLSIEMSNGVSKTSCKRRLSALRKYYEFLQSKKYIKNKGNYLHILQSVKLNIY